jgi:hypothetical protein
MRSSSCAGIAGQLNQPVRVLTIRADLNIWSCENGDVVVRKIPHAYRTGRDFGTALSCETYASCGAAIAKVVFTRDVRRRQLRRVRSDPHHRCWRPQWHPVCHPAFVPCAVSFTRVRVATDITARPAVPPFLAQRARLRRS